MLFRMGLFGAGKWAQNIVRVLTERSDVRIEAALVRDTRLVREGLANVPLYDNAATLLAKHRLDGVVISTPAATHAALALAALGRGVPCFLEKPAALSVQDMENIRAKAESTRLPVVVDYIHLYSAPFQALVREMRERGKPRKIVGLAGNTQPSLRDCSLIWDWGAHDVAMSLACLGFRDTKVRDAKLWPAGTGTADGARLRLDWGGIPVHLRFSQALPRKWRFFAARYDDETLVYTAQPNLALTRWHRGKSEVLVAGGAQPLKVALDSFIDKATKRPTDTGALAASVEVTRILALCDRASRM